MPMPKKFNTTADRVAADRAAIASRGGAILQVRLTPEANAALGRLAIDGKTKSAIISMLLEEASMMGSITD